MENKKMMWVWILIVLIVVAGLVYITINKKAYAPIEPKEEAIQIEQKVENNKIMDNTQNSVEGVKVVILKEGTGDVVKSGDTVAMNYTGTFTDGKAFDSNIDPKFEHVQPFVFTLGTGQVIKGWDVGIVGMKVGEKRKLELAPDFAYGERGQGSIPSNATLIFEVELLAIKK